jgi:hypothetical protein
MASEHPKRKSYQLLAYLLIGVGIFALIGQGISFIAPTPIAPIAPMEPIPPIVPIPPVQPVAPIPPVPPVPAMPPMPIGGIATSAVNTAFVGVILMMVGCYLLWNRSRRNIAMPASGPAADR